MAKFGEGVPLSALGGNLTASVASFRKDVTKLNKAAAMKIVASLNLLTGDEVTDTTQNQALSLMKKANLIDDISYKKIEQHTMRRRNQFIVFHRTHAFEMFRALLLWASESSGTDAFLNPKAHRNSLIRAILLSLHVQDERMVPATLVAEPDEKRNPLGCCQFSEP